MEHACCRPEELGEILDLKGTDPRRLHLSSCPRCRALAATFEEFREAPPAVTGPRLAHALSLLGQSLDEEIHGRAARRKEPGSRSWLPAIGFRILRPAIALAAVFLAVVLVDTVRSPSPERGVVLRTDHPDAGAFLPGPARMTPDGSLELSWPSLTGADSYRVTLLDAELREIASFDAPANELRLGAEEARRLLPRPGAYAVSVAALSGGDEIDRSSPRTFRWGTGDAEGRPAAE